MYNTDSVGQGKNIIAAGNPNTINNNRYKANAKSLQ